MHTHARVFALADKVLLKIHKHASNHATVWQVLKRYNEIQLPKMTAQLFAAQCSLQAVNWHKDSSNLSTSPDFMLLQQFSKFGETEMLPRLDSQSNQQRFFSTISIRSHHCWDCFIYCFFHTVCYEMSAPHVYLLFLLLPLFSHKILSFKSEIVWN